MSGILCLVILQLIISLPSDIHIDSPKEDFPNGIQFNITTVNNFSVLHVGPFIDNDGYVLSNAEIIIDFDSGLYIEGTTDPYAYYSYEFPNNNISEYLDKPFELKLYHERVNRGNKIEFQGTLTKSGLITVIE
jgi:hypothetical protein